jgi:hypothetical protein
MRPNFISKPVIAGLALTLLLSSLSFKCDGGPGPSDPYRKAAKASDDIAMAIRAMIFAKRKLALDKTITPDEDRTLIDILLKLNKAEGNFLVKVKALKSDPDPVTRARLATLFASVLSAIDELSKNCSRIENRQARDTLMKIVSTMIASAQIIDAVLRP